MSAHAAAYCLASFSSVSNKSYLTQMLRQRYELLGWTSVKNRSTAQSKEQLESKQLQFFCFAVSDCKATSINQASIGIRLRTNRLKSATHRTQIKKFKRLLHSGGALHAVSWGHDKQCRQCSIGQCYKYANYLHMHILELSVTLKPNVQQIHTSWCR